MADALDVITVDTGKNPGYSVIWMHGLGADANDFVPLVPELGLADLPAIRFIFPNAPVRPVTANGGYLMRAWYDIHAFGGSSRVDEEGIRQAVVQIDQLIEVERQRGVPEHRILLAGFSQGAAMAYMTGLGYPRRLGGIMALSGFMPAPRLVAAGVPDVPVFAAHGRFDDVVSLQRGLDARAFAQARGHAVAWHEYAMAHSLCDAEVADIATWIRARVSG